MTIFFWTRTILLAILACIGIAALPVMPSVVYAIIFPGMTLLVIGITDAVDSRVRVIVSWK